MHWFHALYIAIVLTALLAAYFFKKRGAGDDRRLVERALEEKSHALAERVKELNCLYAVSEIVRKPGSSIEKIMRETAAIIPSAWQFPDIACARLTMDGATYLSGQWRESPWRQAADILVNGMKRGTVEVFYFEERAAADEGPFLREERDLINVIAERLGGVVEGRWAMHELKMSEAILRDRNSKLEFDLHMAQSAQKGIMRLSRPRCAYLTVDFRYIPMDQVGGDYFSFFESGDGSIGCFIGDISGHGIAAALFIALIKSITDRVFRESAAEPDAYLRKVNDELLDYISSNFVTAIYGIFSRAEDGTVTFRYANGAHVRPILMRREGACEFHGVANSLVGVFGGMDFEVNEMTLRGGDRLFLLTDAIPETVNEERKMIGFAQGMLDMIARCRRDTLGETLDGVIGETARYRNFLPQGDDITIIGFEAL